MRQGGMRRLRDETERQAKLEAEIAKRPFVVDLVIAVCNRCGEERNYPHQPAVSLRRRVHRLAEIWYGDAVRVRRAHVRHEASDCGSKLMTAMERYAKQCEEWTAIAEEKIAVGLRPTAYQVTLEQRKRLLARGERLVTYEELEAEAHYREAADALERCPRERPE